MVQGIIQQSKSCGVVKMGVRGKDSKIKKASKINITRWGDRFQCDVHFCEARDAPEPVGLSFFSFSLTRRARS